VKGYYRLVVELSAHGGYRFLRPGKGAYELWGNGARVQILSRNISVRHMANAIMKQVGIARRF